MTVNDLKIHYGYGYWANKKLLGVLSQLTPEQFTTNVAGSYGSIRNTMVHIMSAEWGWLERCGGTPRGPALKAADFPTLDSVIDAWTKVEGYVRAFLSTLREEDLTRRIEFAFGSAPPQSRTLCELMHHGAIHAVHHRGQIAMLLRMLGYTPGNFDILFYYAEPHAAAR